MPNLISFFEMTLFGVLCINIVKWQSDGVLSKGSRNASSIHDDYRNTKEYIDYSHYRNNLFCNLRNTLKTTNYNKSSSNCDYGTTNYSCPGIIISKKRESNVSFISIKSILNSTTNTVYLSKCTDTKKTYESSENSKENCKPFPVLTHTFFNYIEWTTKNVTIFLNFTILNRKHTFSILSCSTKKSSNPHPEKSTRTTGKNSSSNTYDVTSTNCCRKCSTKCREAGKLTLTFIFLEDALKSTTKLSKLNTTCRNCHYDTGNQNECNCRDSPYNVINSVKDLFKHDFVYPLKKIKSRFAICKTCSPKSKQNVFN